jgi:hypothetical protein
MVMMVNVDSMHEKREMRMMYGGKCYRVVLYISQY